MSDLTERLAAKLRGAHWSPTGAADIAILAPTLLPLLLSEPELVAGLAPEVKREALRQLLDERCKVLSSTDWRALADSAMQVSYWTPYVTNIGERHFVGTLAPSPAPLEGTNDE